MAEREMLQLVGIRRGDKWASLTVFKPLAQIPPGWELVSRHYTWDGANEARRKLEAKK
jgi:hypothetical protein